VTTLLALSEVENADGTDDHGDCAEPERPGVERRSGASPLGASHLVRRSDQEGGESDESEDTEDLGHSVLHRLFAFPIIIHKI